MISDLEGTPTLSMSLGSKSSTILDNKSDVAESGEENVEFFKAREDSAEVIVTAEEPRDLVALRAEDTIVGRASLGGTVTMPGSTTRRL